MQNMKKKDLLAIITGNPLSNEKVNTLPENLLGILFEDKTSQHKKVWMYNLLFFHEIKLSRCFRTVFLLCNVIPYQNYRLSSV